MERLWNNRELLLVELNKSQLHFINGQDGSTNEIVFLQIFLRVFSEKHVRLS